MALRETVERLRKTRTEEPKPADAVQTWRVEVARLYETVTDWLRPLVEEDGVVLTKETKAAYEDSVGSYEIDQLDIEVGDEVVRFDPKGTVVIGARGRIDVTLLGSGDPSILVLTGEADQPAWSIVDRSARTNLVPLTRESFEALLERLLESYEVRAEVSM